MLNNTAMNAGGTAIKNLITHIQIHSADPGAAGTTSPVGARVPNTASVGAGGTITWTNVAFTGLGANASVSWVSYWSAITSGTYYGKAQLTGDATANAAGEYTVTSITETASAT